MDGIVEAPALDPLLSGLASLPQDFLPGPEGAGRAPGALEVCGEHRAGLSLFCLDELQPVCRDCGGSDRHAGHRVYPVTEAVNDCKGELVMSLSKLQDVAIKLEGSTHTCQHASTHNQLQAQQTEEQMKQEFERLHQFLREEEEARLSMLRQEEEERRRRVEEKRDAMTTAMEALEEKIRDIEREMEEGADGLSFLQNYKETVKRTWESHDEPEKVCGPLIDVSKHLGNLRYSVWNKMLNIAPYTPVTLDPTTASPALCLGPGLSCVRVSPEEDQRPSLPAGPERFHPYYAVVGREAISSGNHFWDVEVGNSTNWTLGVASQLVRRREEFEACPEAGLWCLSLRDGTYRALATPSQVLPLQETGPPRRVRVSVSWEQGSVVFRDGHTDLHLYTFTHRFTQALQPYFESICSRGQLKVLPRKVTVATGLHQIPFVDEDRQEIHASSNEEAGSVEASRSADEKEISETIRNGSPVKTLQAGNSTDDPVGGKRRSADKASRTNQNPIPKSKSTGKTKERGSPASKKTTGIRLAAGYHVSLSRSLQITRSPSNSLATPVADVANKLRDDD